jgi:hypothetical protein
MRQQHSLLLENRSNRSSSSEAYREDRYWFSRYEPHFVRFYSKTVNQRSSSSEAYQEDRVNISIIYDALFD